jgi:hypothetical protein
MCTGGLYRRVPNERHFSAASNFQIGVSRGRRDGIERQAGTGLTAMTFDFKPAS